MNKDVKCKMADVKRFKKLLLKNCFFSFLIFAVPISAQEIALTFDDAPTQHTSLIWYTNLMNDETKRTEKSVAAKLKN